MSFVSVAATSDFPLENIPFGIISTLQDPTLRAATAIGDYAVDLKALAQGGAFDQGTYLKQGVALKVFSEPYLNAFMALGRPAWREARHTLQQLLSASNPHLRDNAAWRSQVLIPMDQVTHHMPTKIGDYTDFYASKEHATNVGTMFRGKDNALMPNWVHIPVGYHGRASSVVVSGVDIKRPHGLVLDPTTKQPYYSASKKMDFELEVAFVVGTGNPLGQPIPFDEAQDHIFGMVLMNDWSARDIQQFEYVPLGPFLGKNFGTTISPWIVTLDALEPFRVPQPVQDPIPADYLRTQKTPEKDAYDVALQVVYQTPTGKSLISSSNLKYMYWSFSQQLAHHTVNGCNMQTGDLCGSGTISGPTEDSYGSLLELTWNGTKPLHIGDQERQFIQGGDSIHITGYCEKQVEGKTLRIGFGSCSGTLVD